MNEELKYCKFCDKEKPIKEFCKSGGCIKNICRECFNKKQKQIYQNSKKVEELQNQLKQKESIIKEVREKVDNFDVFKEFTFPLMKRDEKQQVKSSIDYEWRKSIKEPILEILEKGE